MELNKVMKQPTSSEYYNKFLSLDINTTFLIYEKTMDYRKFKHKLNLKNVMFTIATGVALIVIFENPQLSNHHAYTECWLDYSNASNIISIH